MLKVGFNRHFHRSGYASYRFLVVFTVALFAAIASFAQPTINSVPGPAATNGTFGSPYIYEVTTDASPNSLKLTLISGAPGLTLLDRGDGTASLSGDLAAAGTFPISIEVKDLSDNQTSTQDFNLDVAKAVLTPTADDQGRIYGTTIPVFTISYSGFKFDDDAGDINTPPTASVSPVNASTSPGDYPITVSIASALDNNYSFATPVNGTLHISPAPLTITAVNRSKTYGQANPGFTVVYGAFQNNETELNLTSQATASVTGIDQTTGAGTYTIDVNGGSSPNYAITRVAGTLTINKATLTVTANDKTRVYGTDNPAFTFDYGGFLNGDNTNAVSTLPGATVAADATTDVGTYTITPGGAVAANYNFNYITGNLTINKAPLTVTADPKTKVYGADVPELTFEYSGFLFGQNSSVVTTPPTITTTATASSPVNTYAITLSGGVAKNYSFFTFVSANLTVTKAVLTATANNASRAYGAANPGFTITYTGFVNGDGIGAISQGTATTTAVPTTDVGTVAITPAGASSNNYSFNYVNGTLTINPVLLTAKATNTSRAYGSPEPAFNITYTGFVNGQNESVLTQKPTGTTNATISSDVGTYTITPGGGTAVNYTFAYTTGVLTITKAPVVAIADNKSRTYGENNPTFTVTYTGLKNGETGLVIATPPTLTTTATQFSNAGNYFITISGASDENYSFTYTNGILAVAKAQVLATADDKARVYGTPNPPFTLHYTGLLGTDQASDIQTPPAMATAAGQTSPVGTYNINLGGGLDENYTFIFASGRLVISRAALVAKPDDISRIYGAANPAFTISYTGFVNSETATVLDVKPVATTTATATSNVGTYNITASGASDVNYDITYQPGTLTINKATLTLTANNQTKVYGAANPPLTITYTGFRNGDTPTVLDAPAPATSTTATASSPAGNYAIDLSNGVDNNYTYNLVPGSLTISKANLTITADNKTRVYNTENPTLTLSYSGFVNGDTPGSITSPTPSTSATLTSAVGNYAINLGGGSAANYNILPVTGTLTITKGTPVTAWAPPAAIVYGTPLGAAQLNATADVPGAFDYTPAGGTVLNAGVGRVLTAVFTPSDLTNYNVVNGVTTTITVNKATPVITWANPAAITYGTTLNLTNQLNATANVAGTFNYTPGNGALLNAGASQVLKADFHPTDAANYNDVLNIQRTITVNKATPSVTWNNPAQITYGTPLGATQLNATFSVPGTPVYVPGAGTILPTGANQPLFVNFTPDDQANYNSPPSTQVLITVVKATPVITWSNPADIVYGTALNTTDHLNPTHSVPGTFTFNPPAGTVLSAGSGQTLTATFTPTDVNNYNVVTNLSATINVNKANPVITWPNPSAIVYGTALGPSQQNASTPVAGSFVYNPVPTTVLSAGANQSISATFTPTDLANYNTIVTNRTITVNKATPVVTWPAPGQITYGTPLSPTQQNASANVPGNFIYSPLEGTVLNTGTNQNISVRFEPNDATNYNIVPTTTTQITVVKATPVVTWATPLPIKVGVALTSTQLNATSNIPGTPTYTPNFGTVFNVEGTYTLHVSYQPTDQANYNNVPDTQVQIVVSSKENPVITWSNPSPITYGMALGASELNATGSVQGTTTYDPVAGTKLNAGTNQSLKVTFTPNDQVNYNIVSKTVPIDVNKATLTATANNASRPYGSTNPTFGLSYTGFVNGDVQGLIDTPPTTTCAAIAANPAGSTFPIVPSGGSDNNYQFTYVNGTLTIDKATLTATANNQSRAYGLSNPTLTISYSGFANNDNETSIVQPGISTTALITSNVGNYPITLSGGSASNYNIALQPGTLNITQALLIVIGSDLTKVYGANNPVLTFPLAFKYGGFRNGDDETVIVTPPTATTSATAASDVGVYAISISGGSAQNYSFVPLAGSLTIGKAPLTIKADDKSRPYGQANPLNTLSFTGFVNGDDKNDITLPTFNGPNATPTSDASSYAIQLSGGSAGNYDITLQNGSLIVTKATLTAKPANKSRVYGDANPQFDINYTGFLNGDDSGEITPPTASTTATVTSSVNTYPITLTGGTATNYDFTLQTGILTITPAPLTARAADRTRAYGVANPNLGIIYTGFLNGDTRNTITQPTPSTTATITSDFGTYPITLAGGSALNYTLTLVPGTFTISKAVLTATADAKTKVYGTLNPSNSITYSGFLNGDDAADITPPVITGPAANALSPVGNYPITLSGGSALNYSIALVNGSLAITKAPLTAKANNQSRPYGVDSAFHVTYTGFVNGENSNNITKPIPSTVATATSNVGTYPIKLSGTTANYDFIFVDGTLTVNKASVIVTAENKTRPYGNANPTFTVTYSGLANNETASVIDTPPLVTTAADLTTPASPTPIVIQVSGAVDNNYSFSYVAGSLTVTKAPLTAKADDKSRPYGSANPTNTITYTGFKNGEGVSVITQPNITSPATATSPVGTYPIIVSNGSATNYDITLQNGTLTVAPAIITVKAIDKSKTYGANNPELTVTYTGFVNGQSISDIDVQATATTAATITTPAGTYPITAAGATDNNYGFAYTDGQLTIDKATLTATADPKTTTYGTIPALTISYSGFVNGEDASVIETPPGVGTMALPTTAPGTYPIALNGGSDENYNIVDVAGTLTITKAPLTAKAEDKSRITGVANPEFTIAYSGFVNGESLSDINTKPVASTTANLSSLAGNYTIDVSGGNDDHYDFVYQPGTLTIVLDNPPVAKNFLVETDEDTRFTFTLDLFETNRTDEPNGKIVYIKLASLPLNGTLFKGATRAVVNDEVAVTGGQMEDLYYVPNSNYAGNDPFNWNLFDGSYLAVNNATITIKVRPVNDPPVLSNIEPNAILYSPGDKAVPITGQMIINDVDDNFIFSASVKIAENRTDGDELAIQGGVTGTKIEATYDASQGELTLTGKETRTAYETILKKVMFSTPVNASITEKNVTLVVRDSIASSNIASRSIEITELLPELDIVNAFTPNGDGVNDDWDIRNLDSYSEVMISVFNRDGAKVFSCTSNDCKWDGRSRGELQPAGPYSYVIDLNNGKRRYKGTVNVLR